MQETPRTSDFALAAGISMAYASEILSGKRKPSRAMAFAIYRKTGRKFGPIAHLSDADIDTLERLEPAPSDQSAAA